MPDLIGGGYTVPQEYKRYTVLLTMLLLIISILTTLDFTILGFDSPGRSYEADPADREDLILLSDVNPGTFTENLGQLEDPSIEYYTTGELRFGFTPVSVRVVIDEEEADSVYAFDMRFAGSRSVHPAGIDEAPGISNYFRGSDRSSWVTGVHSWNRVIYKDLWPCIDLVYHYSEHGLKYDFIVHPGGDPSDIGIEYIGVDDLRVINNVDIAIDIGGRIIKDTGLNAFQEGRRIDASYRVDEKMLSVDIGDYNHDYDLVIDPLIKQSTYVGGSGFDMLSDILVDDGENVYLCGVTDSTNFPTTPGVYRRSKPGSSWDYDSFVTRLSPDLSSVLVSTYIGGSDYDYIYSMAVDEDGYVYVTGLTYSINYPVTKDAFQNEPKEDEWGWVSDSFITRFEPDLSDLVYSTYIGGTDWDQSICLDVDSAGRAYIAGITYSNDFYNTTGAYQNEMDGWGDAFVLCLEANGSALAFSTFLGGFGYEEINDIKLDDKGDIILVGETDSSDFPTTEGVLCEDFTTSGSFWSMGFLTVLSGDGSSIDHSTYFGNDTYINTLEIGSEGDYYIGGVTYANNKSFPLTAGAYDTNFGGRMEGFFARITRDLKKLPFCTYIGGDDGDYVVSVSIDDDDFVYLSGETASSDFPETKGSMQVERGDEECFITVFHEGDPDLFFSSYYGSSDDDYNGFSALNRSGGLYVAGYTDSDDFPVTEGSYDTTYNGNTDMFISLLKMNSYIPEPPLDLKAVPGDCHVNLTWNIPAHDGNETVTNYTIFRGIDPRYMDEVGDTSAGLRWFNSTELENGKEYFFMVSAVNIVGIGFPTNVISAVPVTVPGPVTNFEWRSGSEYANISWDHPLDYGGMSSIRFRLYMGGSIEGMEVVESDYNMTCYNFTNLINGEPRYFGVSAYNGYGEGPVTATDEILPLGLPTAPMDLVCLPGESSMNLSWSPPGDTGGGEAVVYNVYGGLYPFSLDLLSSGKEETWYLIDDLRDGHTYYATVSALNSIGEGGNTSLVSFVPYGHPSGINDQTIGTGDGFASLSWSPPVDKGGHEDVTYSVYMSIEDSDWTEAAVQLEEPNFRIDTLQNGKLHRFTVSAVNLLGEGPLSEPISGTPIGPPSDVSIVEVISGGGFISISWSEPGDDGGDPEIRYEISMGASGEVVEPYSVITETMINITGLTNGREYHLYVTPMNTHLRGSSSDVITATPMAIPTPPRNPYAVAGNRSITLSWDPPSDTGGAVALTYSVFMGSDPGSMQLYADSISGTETEIDDLQNGEIYFLSVSAVSSAGSSSTSISVFASPMAPPSAPLDLTGSNRDEGIDLEWSPPVDDGGRAVSGYIIYRGDAPGRLFRLTTVENRTTYHDPDVAVGRDYYYAVSCINEAGESPMTDPVMATPRQADDDGSGSFLLVIIAGVILLIIIASVIVIIATRSKKDQGQTTVPAPNYQYMSAPPQVYSIDGGTIDSDQKSYLPPAGQDESRNVPPG